jgi:aspartate/methionine/tyrosine aminotransferase
MERALLEQVVEIARSCGAYVLSDEVYRGTDQQGAGFTTSVADLYEKGISTGSMSKTWSLAGLRVGWIAAPIEVIQRVQIHRDYNTISVGMLNDLLASIALENRGAILERNHGILRENLSLLDGWIADESRLSYLKPKSGTTAWVRVETGMTSRDFCVALLEKTGVMFTPGSALDGEGYVRIGYANNRDVLVAGLARTSDFLHGVDA